MGKLNDIFLVLVGDLSSEMLESCMKKWDDEAYKVLVLEQRLNTHDRKGAKPHRNRKGKLPTDNL